MSCAVMFQPCLTNDSMPLSLKTSAHGPDSATGSSSLGFSSVPRRSYNYPLHHTHPHISHFVENERLQHNELKITASDLQTQHTPAHAPSLHPSRGTPILLGSPCSDLPQIQDKKNPAPHHDIPIASRIPASPPQHQPHSSSSSRESSPPEESAVKYLSANCVLVTHYRGDVASVVDEHFSRALSIKSPSKPDSPFKAQCPMPMRNFPPSFYQPHLSNRPSLSLSTQFATHSSAELYEAYHGGLHALQTTGADPWSYSLSSQTYGHRGVGHDVYHPTMPSSHSYQYPSISGLQQTFPRLSSVTVSSQIAKADSWSSRYYDSFGGPTDLPTGLESSYSASHYSSYSGLESGVTQDCAKDFYWL